MLADLLPKLVGQEDLTQAEMTAVMNEIMGGLATDAQIGALLTALRIKGESVAEISAAARVMRQWAVPLPVSGYAIDTCGTGGDGAGTFNISTAVAFVAAAAGAAVVKHGNRSVSSKCGSADVLEALGINIHLDAPAVQRCLQRCNIGFVFAPDYHQAMRHVAGPRRELGMRTMFNILGPLANPAAVKGQVLGVFDAGLVPIMAGVLQELGLERALVVHGRDGLDEITTTAATRISELKDGRILDWTLDPADYGITLTEPEFLIGGGADRNARIVEAVLRGESGPARDIVQLNAAAAIYVGRQADSFAEGFRKAGSILDGGHASEVLEALRSDSQQGVAAG